MADAIQKLDFSVVGGDAVSSCQWQEVSALFSSAYGFYSDRAPRRAGDYAETDGKEILVIT